MSLGSLHSAYLAKLDGEALLDYLLSCQEYLKEEDVNGWMKRFAPESSTESKEQEKPAKRRRMSPDCVQTYTPFPPCKRCQKSEDIIDDIREGRVVCTACGLVQIRQSLGTGVVNMSNEQLTSGNNKKVHLYSRVVYFRSFVTGLMGNTRPNISPKDLESLRATCAGQGPIDELVVVAALKKLGLSVKYRRHKYSLASMLNKDFKAVNIPGAVFFELLRLFRVIECHWMHGMKRKLRERRVFFSYPYVFYQLCYHLGCMQYTGPHHLLHDRVRLEKLHYAYGCIAKKAKIKFNVTVYREKL
jgi:Zn-finger protein